MIVLLFDILLFVIMNNYMNLEGYRSIFKILNTNLFDFNITGIISGYVVNCDFTIEGTTQVKAVMRNNFQLLKKKDKENKKQTLQYKNHYCDILLLDKIVYAIKETYKLNLWGHKGDTDTNYTTSNADEYAYDHEYYQSCYDIFDMNNKHLLQIIISDDIPKNVYAKTELKNITTNTSFNYQRRRRWTHE